MNLPSIDHLDNEQLSHLLNPEQAPSWSPQDSAEALRHELGAKLLPDLASTSDNDRSALERSLGKEVPTFLEALTAKKPDIELLNAIKRFARAVKDASDNPLSGTPATVLYFAAIAAAMVSDSGSITTLDDLELREGLIWAGDQLGAEQLQLLLSNAAAMLENPRKA